MVEKAQLWDDREWLEKEVSFAFQKFMDILEDMDAEIKAHKLGEVITTFKRDIEELNALVKPDTALDKAAECKSTIEDLTT